MPFKEVIVVEAVTDSVCHFMQLILLLIFFFRLTLLWYHTVVRPFCALDGNNMDAGKFTEDFYLIPNISFSH